MVERNEAYWLGLGGDRGSIGDGGHAVERSRRAGCVQANSIVPHLNTRSGGRGFGVAGEMQDSLADSLGS